MDLADATGEVRTMEVLVEEALLGVGEADEAEDDDIVRKRRHNGMERVEALLAMSRETRERGSQAVSTSKERSVRWLGIMCAPSPAPPLSWTRFDSAAGDIIMRKTNV